MDIEKKIKEILIEKTKASIIVLFGSFTKNNFRSDSDIDIAFFSDRKIGEYERFLISQEIANSLNRDVDLIDMKKASTVLNCEILGTGKVIYYEDENRLRELQISILKDYCLLNEERAVILKKVHEKGRVYVK